MSTPVYEIDPLDDDRWPELVNSHPSAEVFHTRSWMAALRATYGYRVRALTTSPPDARALSDGLPYCEVKSLWTGKRLVSLPFSDFCGSLGSPDALAAGLRTAAGRCGCRYAEIRPSATAAAGESAPAAGYGVSQRFFRHTVYLGDGPEAVYGRLHKDSIVRKIQRATREGLRTETSTGNDHSLREFYRLFVLTRRRHGYPPPPLAWFQNVIALAEPGMVSISLARTPDGEAIGTLFLLRHRATVYYKYGASDERRHALGAMPLLFWSAMKEACRDGLRHMDLGRSDMDGAGLLDFKRKLGGVVSTAEYWRTPPEAPRPNSGGAFRKTVCHYLPERALIWAGTVLYPHIG